MRRYLPLLCLLAAWSSPVSIPAADRVSLSADYRSGREATRVVLTLSRYVPYSISQPPGELVVRFQTDEVSAGFDTILVEDGALERIAFGADRGRSAVTLQLGPEFRSYQPVVLREPFRLVVELTRRSPWDGPPQRPAPPVGERVPEAVATEAGADAADRAALLEAEAERDLSRQDTLTEPDELPPIEPLGEPEPAGRSDSGGEEQGVVVAPWRVERPAVPPPPRAGGGAVSTVVLDPGHGGSEVGAKAANGLLEKEVTLGVALKLKRLLERNLGVRVVLTRSEDRVLALDDRTAVANNNKADLFISIHANASLRPDAWGAETYFLAKEATDDASRLVAAQENRVVGVDDQSIYGTDLELILWDLAQIQYLEESQSLAEQIQGELNRLLGIRNRGVKQAPFTVLMGATMPAVLVELGFLSNPREARRLAQDEYQEQLSSAIYKAVLGFVRARSQRMGPGSTPR